MKYLATIFLLAFASVAFGQEPGRGYKPLTPERRLELQAISHAKHGGRLAMMAKFQALPAAFDCRDKVPLPVWDQGSCGSCYLVSTVRTVTCVLIAGGYGKADNSFVISSQFGMDRPRDFGGCGGGNGTEVINWMVKHGWPAETYVDLQGVTHKDYPPYEARTGNDRTKAGAKMWMKGADWGFVNANGNPTVEEIKAALFNFGRLNIAIDAGGQFGNGAGTITALGDSIDHEINVAGYDDNKDGGSFLLENQWNTSWGNGGYRWVTYKASRHIVDWFFVTAGPLPPPPPPPGGKAQMVLKIPGMADQIFDVKLPAVPGTGKTVPDATPQELIDAINKIYGPQKQGGFIPKKTTWEANKFYGRDDEVWQDGRCYVAIASCLDSRPPNMLAWREIQHASKP